MRSSWLVVLVLASACATEADDVDTDDLEVPEDDGKADADPELRVRASETTLWADREIQRRGDVFVLNARTSRNLTSGNAFVFDDVYGEFAQRTARTFEVTFPVSTARTLVDGVNLFTALGFTPSSTRPTHLTARTVVRPRLRATTGPSSLALTAELTPVVVAGHTVYRIKGRSTKPMTAVATTMGTARLVDANRFEIDLDFEQLMTQTDPGSELVATVQHAAGPAAIRGHVGLAIKRLGLTVRDVETQYPVPSCTGEQQACLLGLPDGALDLAACGEAIKVRVCAGTVGLFADAAAIDAARAGAAARLVTFGADAEGLVGTERAPDLTISVREVISGRLDAEHGIWLVTPAARDAVLARAVEVPFDDAYAFPLYFVDGVEPVPGDAASARQIAGNALLGYLATQDFASTEYGRSYLELTKVYRAQHVQSLRELRTISELVTLGSTPDTDHVIGRWLGSHTEVAIDRTTGEATSVLVEID